MKYKIMRNKINDVTNTFGNKFCFIIIGSPIALSITYRTLLLWLLPLLRMLLWLLPLLSTAAKE